MINEKNQFNTASQTVATTAYSWKRISWGIFGVGLVAALALSFAGSVAAQVSPLQIIPLAQGYAPQKEIELELRGPSDVLQSLLVFQPGGDTGWHTHPGPVVVVVKSGALTEYEANGCVVVHPTGSVFFESKGKVHRAVNQTGVVTEVYATFLSPAGAQPLVPASDPGGRCHDGR